MSGDWVNVTAQKAAEVCADIDLDEASLALLKPAFTPGAFFITLREAGRRIDAAKFLARALPPGEAVRWAVWCAKKSLHEKSSEQERAAVAAAEAWLLEPTEEKARAAWDLAEALKFQNAAAWSAAAPLWCGDNFAPPGAPPVKPPAHLPSRAVAGAVLVGAAADPSNVESNQNAFLDAGAKLAAGAPLAS